MRKTYVDASNKRKIAYTVAISVISIIVFISIILFTYKYKASLSIPAIVALAILGLVIFLIGLGTAVQGGRTIGYFYCSNCNEKFVPSVMSYMCTAHIFKTSYLKCPKCGKKGWYKKKLHDDITTIELSD